MTAIRGNRGRVLLAGCFQDLLRNHGMPTLRKCFDAVDVHCKGVSDSDHLPSIGREHSRGNATWQTLWVGPVCICHKRDQCIRAELPCFDQHPRAGRRELNGLNPVDITSKIVELYRLQLSTLHRNAMYAQLVPIWSKRKPDPLPVRAELRIHPSKVFS